MDKQKRLLNERKRILSEIDEAGGAEIHLQKNRWSVEISDSNIFIWKGFLLGPVGTPYESQHYQLKIDVSGVDYPGDPPKVSFVGAYPYHANVYRDGNICIDILKRKDSGGEWSPILKISNVLLSLVSMLNDPNTSSPANADASRAYDADKTPGKIHFTKTATEHYIKQIE